ncbi:Uncharacterised protein [Mycobacteroides abscessus subsp. abscessus]|nr:Uncharacterised protein [Mycobacteroides abscessus subsp. abscessus]
MMTTTTSAKNTTASTCPRTSSRAPRSRAFGSAGKYRLQASARTPTGTLIRKIHRHPPAAMRIPPTVGPAAKPHPVTSA